MALRPYSDEELNYFKFMSLVSNEFPAALRHAFKTMWDNTIAHHSGVQPWDDSSSVRNVFASTEGGKTSVPTHHSYKEWDCTAMFQATIFAKTFAIGGKTLNDLYVTPRAVPKESFHAKCTLLSSGGNDAEKFALAIDQLRRLRNVLCHSPSSEMHKPTFDLYIQHAKNAFRALGVSTDTIDAIGSLNKSDFPTSRVRELEERIRQENQSIFKWLEGKVNVDMADIKQSQIATKEDIGLLKARIDEDVIPAVRKLRILEEDNASKDDIVMSRQENEEQKIVQEDPDSKPTTSESDIGSSSPLLDAIEKSERYSNRGRVEFQECKYENACEQYTSALKCLPKEQEKERRVKYLSNRAACYVNLRKFEEARKDCDSALLLNPFFTKARYRLVQALQGEGKVAEAFIEVTSLLKKNPLNSAIAELESSLKKAVEDAKSEAMEKGRQGQVYFQESNYDEAVIEFTEGLLLLPRLDMYAQEIKKFYWCRAECHLRKNHLEAALRDCDEGDRLVPQDKLLLYTKMQVLDKMDKFKDCYTVCKTLIQMKFKVSEVKEKIKLLLPKILKENEKSKELEKPGLPESENVTSCKTSKKQLKKGSKKKGKKRTEGASDKNLSSSVDNPSSSEHSTDTSFALAENTETKEGKVISLSLEEEVEQVNYTEIENENAEFLVKTEEAGSSEGDKAGKDCSQEEKNEANKKCNDQGGVSGTADLNTSVQSSLGEAYPRRILSISEGWSCWQSSVCTVNKQLCRSLAKNEDVHVACLVLDATDQETIAATRDGINLMKAAPQPGIRERDERLLSLHSDFPFKVDLVIGHGMVSGTAAAIQAKRLSCKLLHIFHTLPIEDEQKEQSERDLGLSADFVAGIGPSAVEEWEAVLNRRVFTIIPGLPEVVPRNEIMTPQSRCLVLGNMCAQAISGLDLVTAAISKCRRRAFPVHLTVVGTEREKVQDLKEEMKSVLCSSNVHVVVKPFDVTHEVVGVEVRGVSVVVIPSTSDAFGMLALEAVAAKVPIVVTSLNGIAKFLHTEFRGQFLKFLCSTGDEMDYVEALASAVDAILDDRQEAFNLAACLWDKWNSRFTWDVAVSELLRFLSSFGMFSASSRSITKQITLPSQCSDLARKFMEEEVELLNRRRAHVLFLSPENVMESPFIHYFAQVPWAAVLDFDVNSVTTGFLSSCENYCEQMGMKICRILPPSSEEAHKKCSVVLSTGIPWVLLEGMPENERIFRVNLEWMREFFMALAKAYHAPITFLVLWRSQEETETLCRSLSKILTIVQGSPLYSKVKMVIASTGVTVSNVLEDVADDWKVQVKIFSLEDVCNALCQCITSSPFIQENRDFSLPVADPDDPNRVNFKVLPPSSRWINAEMEILFTSVGNAPQYGTDDAYHFYRGGLISWYALQMGYAVERRNWKALKHRIDELLVRAGSVRLQLPHQRGAGGSTSARRILFDYHEKYPCVLLRSVGHAEVAQGIKVLAEFCKLPVIILVDRKQEEIDYFVVNNLFNILSNDRIPCLILEVTYQKKKEETSLRYPGKSEETSPVRLAEELSIEEADNFVKIYSVQRKEKLSKLRSLLQQGPKQLQIPFYYALTTFEDRFTGLEPFVRDCLENLGATERKILLFLAMAYHYGGNSLSANEFSNLLKAPRGEVALLESVLPELTMELLLEEDDKWRPRHDLIAVEMLRQLLTVAGQCGLPAIHLENWKSRLAEAAVECFGHMSNMVVTDMLVLSRIPNDSHFTQLISDIPFEEDAIKLFERAISVFPDDPFFKVHLGRFYSIQKRSAGLHMAIKYTDEGILCSQSYPRNTRGQFAQMKGMVYSREVSCLIDQRADIRSIANTAEEAVTNFRRAVSIDPDFVNGYIPEVRMMCNVFDFIDKQTGNLFEYVKSADVHPFITHAISDTSNTLECVPDSDEYPYWRMRLACLGRRNFSLEQGEKTLELLYHLRNSGKGSRGSVNRQIVIMRLELSGKSGDSVSSMAPEMIELLNEALKHDTNIEQTMRLWVKIAPFIPVALSEAENKVFHWCSKTKSVRSYLYKLIIACLHLLEGGSSTYAEIMKNAYDDLNAEIKTINRDDVGRCRHPDRPVVWLGEEGRGMGHLVFLSDNSSEQMDVRMKRSIDSKYTNQLRPLTGRIIKTGPKVGTIKVKQGLDVTFRTDLCEPTPLVSSSFMNKKVQFFLAFNLFGPDAYNVRLVAE